MALADHEQTRGGSDERPTSPPAVEVARSLVNYLFHSGEVALGQRIPPERQLAEAFGVGRSAIREALKSLSLLGLVKIRQGDGTYLVGDSLELLPEVMEWGLLLGPQNLDDAIEARTTIDVRVAQLAARTCNRRDQSQLALRLQALDPSQEADVFTGHQLALHRELASVAANSVFNAIVVGLQSVLRVWLVRSHHENPTGRLDTKVELAAVIDAITANDEAAAAEAMQNHLDAMAQRMRAANRQ